MKKSSPLLSIFLIVLVDVLGLTIILPLLPFYAESLGASPRVVGLLVSAYAVCQLIAGPPLGHLSDRVGRRPVLLVSPIGTCIGFQPDSPKVRACARRDPKGGREEGRRSTGIPHTQRQEGPPRAVMLPAIPRR